MVKHRRLIAVPTTLKQASAFVGVQHRHHLPPQGGRVAIGVALADEPDTLRGVAIIGRPVSRLLDDGWTAEVVRLATDGTPNACSFLYGAAWRCARAIGYTRLVTYILDSEPGTSLIASGWKLSEVASKGGRWSRPSRVRSDTQPTGPKRRYEVGEPTP